MGAFDFLVEEQRAKNQRELLNTKLINEALSGIGENFLEATLQQKKLEQQQSQFDVSTMLDRQRLGQQQSQFDIGQETSLAKSALRRDPVTGAISRDVNLQDPAERILNQAKAMEAQRKIEFFNRKPGDSLVDDIIIKDVDPITGLPKTGTTRRGIEEELEIKERFKARQALNEFIPAADKAVTAITGIEDLAKDLPQFSSVFGVPFGGDERGFFEANLRRFNAMMAKVGNQKEVTRFVGKVSQELIPLARNLAEEKGPITDRDIERISEGLGKLDAPLEDKLFLLNELRDKVSEALETKVNLAGFSVEEFYETNPGIANSIFGVNFNSVEEALASDLPNGTKIRIKGKPAFIRE